MGNGVSGDQGNLPAHGKRDVREGLGAKRHDWSELVRTREIVTPPPNPTTYIGASNAGPESSTEDEMYVMYVDANVRSVPDAYIDAQLRDLKPEADPPLEAYISATTARLESSTGSSVHVDARV